MRLEAVDSPKLVGAGDLDALVLDQIIVSTGDGRHLSAPLSVADRYEVSAW